MGFIKFIKVTLCNKKGVIDTGALINANEISYIYERESDSPCPFIRMKDGNWFYIKESFEYLEKKIKEAEECYK